MRIYRHRLISKYLVPQQNFMNLLQEKLPSSLTGLNEDEQVSWKKCLFFLFDDEYSRKNSTIVLRMFLLLIF